jgi:hypothetical protein
MSVIAMISMSTLFLLETKSYFFSTTLETDLSLHSIDDEPSIQLNFDITMMDLPCEQATVDVFTVVGFEKKITKNIRKYPVDEDGVRQRYEARDWHQNDIELWDPAVLEAIDDLHKDGEDALLLDAESFPYGAYPRIHIRVYFCPRVMSCLTLSRRQIVNSIGYISLFVRQILRQRLQKLPRSSTYMGGFGRSCHGHIHEYS